MARYEDQESVLRLGQIDPECAHFMESLSKSDIPDLSDPNNARSLRRIGDKGRRDALGPGPVDESTRLIPMRDGHMNGLRIFTPQSPVSAKGRPLVVLVYGGGFLTGDDNSATPYSVPIAAAYNAVVVNVSYRLAPEYKFPTQGDDVWDALCWVSANASDLGADLSAGFVLGGESAGGNIAAATAVQAFKESVFPALTGLWLSVPWLLVSPPEGYEDVYLAREQNKDSPFINEAILEVVKDLWNPDFTSPKFSPFNSLNSITSQHPPTYLQVCGMDPLRDDGIIYERLLRERGVKTRLDVYPGVPHAHWAMCPYIYSSQKSMVEAVIGVGWLLGKAVPVEDVKYALGKLAADYRE